MIFFMFVLTAIFWVIAGLLALLIGYLLLLTGCAWFAPRLSAPSRRGVQNRFAILVPAHNEERLLPGLLDNLAQLDYPKSFYTVYVVADNCTDRTASLAKTGGAVTYERFDTENAGKGCALQWLLSQISDTGASFDAAVVLDADSIVSTNFLTVMDAKLQQGAKAIQAYYAVRDADQSWATSLRAAALAVLHYLRPQGRMVLGGSAGLKGNGMVFHHTVLERHAWSASVTEDIQYHMSLILDGERVHFAPDAVVWAEIPTNLRESNTQNVRWEQGRLEMAKQYVPLLLKLALFPNRSAKQVSRKVLFDAAMEHMIPPFSVLLGLSFVTFVLAIITRMPGTIEFATLILAGQAIYLISGMILAKIPLKAYLAMLYLPIFLGWKIWLYIKVMIKQEKQGWVRTKRIGEQP